MTRPPTWLQISLFPALALVLWVGVVLLGGLQKPGAGRGSIAQEDELVMRSREPSNQGDEPSSALDPAVSLTRIRQSDPGTSDTSAFVVVRMEGMPRHHEEWLSIGIWENPHEDAQGCPAGGGDSDAVVWGGPFQDGPPYHRELIATPIPDLEVRLRVPVGSCFRVRIEARNLAGRDPVGFHPWTSKEIRLDSGDAHELVLAWWDLYRRIGRVEALPEGSSEGQVLQWTVQSQEGRSLEHVQGSVDRLARFEFVNARLQQGELRIQSVPGEPVPLLGVQGSSLFSGRDSLLLRVWPSEELVAMYVTEASVASRRPFEVGLSNYDPVKSNPSGFVLLRRQWVGESADVLLFSVAGFGEFPVRLDSLEFDEEGRVPIALPTPRGKVTLYHPEPWSQSYELELVRLGDQGVSTGHCQKNEDRWIFDQVAPGRYFVRGYAAGERQQVFDLSGSLIVSSAGVVERYVELPRFGSFELVVQSWNKIPAFLRKGMQIRRRIWWGSYKEAFLDSRGRATLRLPESSVTASDSLSFWVPLVFPHDIPARVLSVDLATRKIFLAFPTGEVKPRLRVKARHGGEVVLYYHVDPKATQNWMLPSMPQWWYQHRSDPQGKFWIWAGWPSAFEGVAIEHRSGSRENMTRGWFQWSDRQTFTEWDPGGRWIEVRARNSVSFYPLGRVGKTPATLSVQSGWGGADQLRSKRFWLSEDSVAVGGYRWASRVEEPHEASTFRIPVSQIGQSLNLTH